MLPGAPSRLPSSYPLRRALGFAHPGELLGAWVRVARWPLHLRAGGCALLCTNDLGSLLRRCNRVLLRVEQEPTVLPADTLISWRTLQIVVGAPYLPQVHRLRALFPDLVAEPGGLAVPLGLDTPEPVLGWCNALQVPVVATRIEYRAVASR